MDDSQEYSNVIHVERWPTEIPLLMLVVLLSAVIWLFLVLTIFGLVYVFLIGIALFFAHVGFVAYIRGNAVRLGPDQLPELYRRVQELSARVGLREAPEAYLMQAGGALNALATKFMGSDMIVLYSDLLEACGENKKAADMVIAHELGHIKCGHLRFVWAILPGLFFPFIGAAYSRAREYTCDRFGMAGCGDPQAGLLGLAVLAAGRKEAPAVNLQALARQRESLNTGWMTLGKWLMSHPPLCDRILALHPGLIPDAKPLTTGPVRALAIIGLLCLLPLSATVLFVYLALPAWKQAMEEARQSMQQAQQNQGQSRSLPALGAREIEAFQNQVERDFAALAEVAYKYHDRTGGFPESPEVLYDAWRTSNPTGGEPFDPFDGYRYGYWIYEGAFYLVSSGPDRVGDTDDDIVRVFSLEGESQGGR